MARLSRIVIPQVAHHVTQRGNRRLPVFFSDADRRAYLALLASGARASGTRCLAWCLMDNHVHLILVPSGEDGLRAMLGEAHRRYTSAINRREGWRGHLFQARFASYPMDDAHLLTAVRYVELNPVAAGLGGRGGGLALVERREPSGGQARGGDPLTDVGALGKHVRNWRAMLRHGLEAGELGPEGEIVAQAIEGRLRTGRPPQTAWIGAREAELDRPLAPRKAGRKPRRAANE